MSDQAKKEEIARNMRETLTQSLELIATKSKQLEYQETVAIANVSAELFCQWEDNYCPEGEIFRSAFTEEELHALADFNLVFDQVCEELSEDLLPITEFVKTPQWERYSKAAQVALSKLR